jgi:hypothetical protein
MPYFTKERIIVFFALFAVEGPVVCAFMYYLFLNVFNEASCPASDVARIVWIFKRLFLLVLPSFAFLWGAMRAFDTSTKAEDPFAGVESKRHKTFQKILTNNTEQTAIFVPAIMSLAVLVPHELWPMVPTFFYTFVIGRWAFGAGYFVPPLSANNPLAPFGTLYGWARSPGMNLTLYPCNFALCFAAFYLMYGDDKPVPAPRGKAFGAF